MNIMDTMERTLHGDTAKPALHTKSTSRWSVEMRAPIDAALHGSSPAHLQEEVGGAPAVDTLHLFD